MPRRLVLGRLHPHTFRHTYATHLRGETGDLVFFADQPGHANLTTTAICSKTLKDWRCSR